MSASGASQDSAIAQDINTGPNTQAALDNAIAAAVNNGSSQARTSLDTLYTPKRVNVLDDGTANAAAFFGTGNASRLHSAGGNLGLGYFVFKDGAHTGMGSVAVGNVAAMAATTANNLTAVGYYAAGAVTTANEVTHIGSYAGFEVPGQYNTSLGSRALCGPNVPRIAGPSATTAISGTAYDTWLTTIPTGTCNTAVGREALATIGSGSNNTAIGWEAAGGQGAALAVSNVTVSGTTVTVTVPDTGGLIVGQPILFSTATTGFTANPPVVNMLYNVTGTTPTTFTYEQSPAPVGTYASGGTILGGVITASNTVAVGSQALFNNQRGSGNIAVGSSALQRHDIGIHNVAIGYAALSYQTNASYNTAIGQNAGFSVSTGGNNTLIGKDAGYTATPANATTTATGQTVIGYQAGQSTSTPANNIVAIGSAALTSGHYSTAVGNKARADGAGSVAIGCDSSNTGANATANNMIALGTALHQVKISNNATGGQSAALGSNSPATTPAAPYTWMKMTSGDGSTVYVPAWK